MFEKRNIEHKMYVSSFPTTFFSVTFPILRRTEQHMIKYVYWSSGFSVLFPHL